MAESRTTHCNLPRLQYALYYQLSPLMRNTTCIGIWTCISEHLIWPHELLSGPLILASGLGLNSVLVTTHPVLLHHVAKASTRPALPMRPEVFNTPGTGFPTQHFWGFPSCPVGRVAALRSCIYVLQQVTPHACAGVVLEHDEWWENVHPHLALRPLLAWDPPAPSS
jgi:hypothetical protein